MTMITPSYLGETIEYSSLHACRSTLEDPTVDEAALAWAMQQRLLAGAALDVYEDEPRVHPDLLQLENVLLVPHLGSGTTETRTAMADLAVENVLAVMDGRAPLTPVSG